MTCCFFAAPCTQSLIYLLTDVRSTEVILYGRDAESLCFVGLPTPTLGLTVRHNDCVLKNDLKKFSLNSSTKRCTIVYKIEF